MIYKVVKSVYEDYLTHLRNRNFQAETREGQLIFISHALLPYYSEQGLSILVEGGTGTGKTLSYLFPLIVERMISAGKLNELKEVPAFCVKDTETKLFLEDKDKDQLIQEQMFKAKRMNAELFKHVSFKKPVKVFVVAYTKVLQDQIINEINEKINPYLRDKNLKEIQAGKIIGKTNYLCSESFEKARAKLDERKEEIQKKFSNVLHSKKQENEKLRDYVLNILNEIDKAKRYINEIIAENIQSVEELKHKYKQDWEEVIDLIEEHSKISIFAPGLTVKEGHLKSECLTCSSTECFRKKDLDILKNSDVIVMNYHSFFNFMKMISSYNTKITKEIEALEKERDFWEGKFNLTIDVNKPYQKQDLLGVMLQEELNKFLDFQKRYINAKQVQRINMFGKTINIQNLIFVFDEAHKFENILIDFFSDELNIPKIIKHLKTFLNKINPLVDEKQQELFFSNKSTRILNAFYQSLELCYQKILDEIKEANDENLFTLENFAKEFFHLPLIKLKVLDRLYEPAEADKIWQKIESAKSKDTAEYNLALLFYFSQIIKKIALILDDLDNMYENDKEKNKLMEIFPIKHLRVVKQDIINWYQFIDIYLYNRFNEFEQNIKTYQYQFQTEEDQKFYETLKQDFTQEINLKAQEFEYYKNLLEYNDVTIDEDSFLKIPKQKATAILNRIFMNNWDMVKAIFTSATMPDFNSFQKYLNIKKAIPLVIESTFDYKKNSMIYVPHDIPLVMQDGKLNEEWLEYTKENLEKYLFALKGGVFILTTSKYMHNILYDYIRSHLKEWENKYNLKITLFNMFTKKKEILEKFGVCDLEKEKHIGIFSKEYFQGIDMVGERLTTIIIPKLPFDEPTSPYIKVKEAHEKNQIFERLYNMAGCPTDQETIQKIINRTNFEFFRKVVLQRASDETRQAIGRLIRSERDAGVVFMLDKRFMKYPQALKNKLPHNFTNNKEELSKFLNNLKEGSLVLNNMFKEKLDVKVFNNIKGGGKDDNFARKCIRGM